MTVRPQRQGGCRVPRLTAIVHVPRAFVTWVGTSILTRGGAVDEAILPEKLRSRDGDNRCSHHCGRRLLIEEFRKFASETTGSNLRGSHGVARPHPEEAPAGRGVAPGRLRRSSPGSRCAGPGWAHTGGGGPGQSMDTRDLAARSPGQGGRVPQPAVGASTWPSDFRPPVSHSPARSLPETSSSWREDPGSCEGPE